MFAPSKVESPYLKDSINHKDHADHDKPGFVVRATAKGYYGLSMREPGDIFRIQFARHFADCNDPNLLGLGWMEKIDGHVSSKKKQGSQQERGAKPPSPDPSERERRMAAVDEMAEAAEREDKEAEVI